LKEQILQLEAHDDFISARDKIGWVQTARVLLVWPRTGDILRRRLDLVLLQRHAAQLGAQLALVTSDPVVAEQARELDLPVFASVEASRTGRWARLGRKRPASPPPRPRLDRSKLRAQPSPLALNFPPWAGATARGGVFALGLAGLIVLAVALAPSATVTVLPASESIQVEVPLVADEALEAVDGTTIPARTVRVELEASGTTATTGLREVPSQPALGTVIFTSLDGTLTLVPAGTGVRTTTGAPARFRTVQDVSLIPAVGATAQAAIEAIDLGPAGNVSAGLINAIDGPLGLQLAVINPGPTVGGALTQQPAVTAADRERLLAELRSQLEGQAVAALESQLAPGEFLTGGSVALAQTVAQTFDYAVGEAVPILPLTLRLAYTGLAVDDNDARLAAQGVLAASLPEGADLRAGSEQFERLPGTLTDAEGRAHLTVRATGVAVPQIDEALLRELVKGQPLPLSQLRLANALPLSALPSIQIEPDWYPRLPWLAFRIDVVVADGA
jgi:hypothetical protein